MQIMSLFRTYIQRQRCALLLQGIDNQLQLQQANAMMEPIAMKMWFRKHLRLIAVLIMTAFAATAYYFAPSKGERQAMELEACKKKCAPLQE